MSYEERVDGARRLLAIEVVTPWPGSVDSYVEQYGIDGFYDTVDARKACCSVRKVEPLRRALARRRGWITGLRREHPRAGRWWWETDGATKECGPHAIPIKVLEGVA